MKHCVSGQLTDSVDEMICIKIILHTFKSTETFKSSKTKKKSLKKLKSTEV